MRRSGDDYRLQLTPTSAQDCSSASRSASVKPRSLAASSTPWQPCWNVVDAVQKAAFARYHARLARFTLAWFAAPVGEPLASRRAERQNALFEMPLE